MAGENPLENMRKRSAQCRRLASETHDERMRWQLIEWANAIDADISRLEAERNERHGTSHALGDRDAS